MNFKTKLNPHRTSWISKQNWILPGLHEFKTKFNPPISKQNWILPGLHEFWKEFPPIRTSTNFKKKSILPGLHEFQNKIESSPDFMNFKTKLSLPGLHKFKTKLSLPGLHEFQNKIESPRTFINLKQNIYFHTCEEFWYRIGDPWTPVTCPRSMTLHVVNLNGSRGVSQFWIEIHWGLTRGAPPLHPGRPPQIVKNLNRGPIQFPPI